MQTRPLKQTPWSVRSFAAEANISKEMAPRLFRAADIAPHRWRSFKLSKRPALRRKGARHHQCPQSMARSRCGWHATRGSICASRRPTVPGSIRSSWFALITERANRRNSFTSVRELKQQIELFVQRYNADASPFQWVATVDSILQKIERIAKGISATGH